MGGGRGECSRLCARPLACLPLSPGGLGPILPKPVTQPPPYLRAVGNALTPLISVPLLPERQDAAIVSFYLATTKFPSSSFPRLRKQKLAMRRNEKLKMCPAIHPAEITKIKPVAKLNRKHYFSQGQAAVAEGLLLSYSLRSLCPLKSETVRNFAV